MGNSQIDTASMSNIKEVENDENSINSNQENDFQETSEVNTENLSSLNKTRSKIKKFGQSKRVAHHAGDTKKKAASSANKMSAAVKLLGQKVSGNNYKTVKPLSKNTVDLVNVSGALNRFMRKLEPKQKQYDEAENLPDTSNKKEKIPSGNNITTTEMNYKPNKNVIRTSNDKKGGRTKVKVKKKIKVKKSKKH